jgi:dTDP-4-dehydrorhamnose reductase
MHTTVRSSWLFGASGACFPKTIMRLAAERDELSVVDDQIGSPTFTGHLAPALLELADARVPGILHVAAAEECSWFRFATEIVATAGLACEVRPCTTAEFPRPAQRPAYSVMRSERGSLAPVLPDWHAGLAAFMTMIVRSA